MKKIHFSLGALALGFAIAPLAASAAPAGRLKIELPPETGVFQPGQHSEIANAQCLICHSTEYVTTQPPLPRAYWKATVEKMQQKFGAPLPVAQVEPLVDYLVALYGAKPPANSLSAPAAPAAAPVPSVPAATASASSPASGTDGASLAARYACLGCHNPTVKIVGPSLQQIAAKYQGDAGARETIALQITQGGSGKWGPIPMPPFSQIPAAEVRTLTDWILAQK